MGNRTISKIDGILGRVNTHPEYSVAVSNRFMSSIREEADRHSLALEELQGKMSRRDIELERNKALKGLHSAREYLAKFGLDVSTLAVLGNLIEPINHPYKQFRIPRTGVGHEIAGRVVPEAAKVPYLVKGLVDFLNTSFSIHPIMRSIEAQLQIFWIHPYEDGNGRVGRLVGDFCLEQRGFPSAVIPVSERSIYVSLVRKVIAERDKGESSLENPSMSENLFYDFIGGKILNSAIRLEDELRKRRMYDVTLYELQDKGVVYSVKKAITNFGRRVGREGVQIRIIEHANGHKRAKFEIIGDIGKDEAEQILKNNSSRYNFNYSLSPRKGCCLE